MYNTYDYNMFSLGSICGVAVAFSQTVMIFPICDLSFGANVFLKKYSTGPWV